MKNILFISNVSLKNPIRGTPLRIYNFLIQIKSNHKLFICAKDVPVELSDYFMFYPGGSAFKRLFYFLNFIKKNKIDVVFTATETGIKLPIFLKAFSGVKIAIDLHGLYGEELYFKGAISNFRRFFYDKFVKFCLNFYDLIFVVSKKLADYYKKTSSRIEVVYGGVNLKNAAGSRASPPVFTIGYMGNARPYQGLDYLLDAAKNIKDKNLF